MRGFFKNNGKGRGLKAKMPFFSLLPSWETGERRVVAGGGPRQQPGPRGRPGGGEKRERGSRGAIPPSILGKEARRAEIHGGGRQQAATAMVAPRWGSTAAMERRESEREARVS